MLDPGAAGEKVQFGGADANKRSNGQSMMAMDEGAGAAYVAYLGLHGSNLLFGIPPDELDLTAKLHARVSAILSLAGRFSFRKTCEGFGATCR